ncbi:MAG: DUF3795 domain-containing protein [Anaerolineae bacterium]|jgi:hypothetical protein
MSTTYTEIAACGLFCENCGSYRRGRCAGCADGGGFKGCKIRICVTDRGYTTCAECDEMESCQHLHSFVSKVMGFIFRSDRPGNLRYLQQHGPEAFVEFKRQQGKQ